MANTNRPRKKLRLAKTLLMESTNQLKDKIQTQLILEEGIIIDPHISTYLHLIDILIIELGVFGENDVLREIELLIDGMEVSCQQRGITYR